MEHTREQRNARSVGAINVHQEGNRYVTPKVVSTVQPGIEHSTRSPGSFLRKELPEDLLRFERYFICNLARDGGKSAQDVPPLRKQRVVQIERRPAKRYQGISFGKIST